MAMGEDLLAGINEARQAHKQAQRRAQHPVECPEHQWPLQSLGDGRYHCVFGGHVITPVETGLD